METLNKGVLMRTLVVLLLFFGSQAHAGLFGADKPPVEFLSLQVTSPYGPDFTVQQYHDGGLTGDHKKTWQKAGDGQWILTYTIHDAMSGKNSLLKMLFVKQGTQAAFQSLMIDGEYQSNSTKASVQQSIVVRLMEKK